MTSHIEHSGGRRRKPEPKRKADLVSEQAVMQAVARARYVLRAAGENLRQRKGKTVNLGEGGGG